MKTSLLAVGLALALSAGAAAAADSPCCASADNGRGTIKHCDSIPTSGLGGCGELDADNCIGGGISAQDDPQAQSPIAGCLCVNGTCVSDGSIGDGDGEATDEICTRDAVRGCDEAGVASAD